MFEQKGEFVAALIVGEGDKYRSPLSEKSGSGPQVSTVMRSSSSYSRGLRCSRKSWRLALPIAQDSQGKSTASTEINRDTSKSLHREDPIEVQVAGQSSSSNLRDIRVIAMSQAVMLEAFLHKNLDPFALRTVTDCVFSVSGRMSIRDPGSSSPAVEMSSPGVSAS